MPMPFHNLTSPHPSPDTGQNKDKNHMAHLPPLPPPLDWPTFPSPQANMLLRQIHELYLHFETGTTLPQILGQDPLLLAVALAQGLPQARALMGSVEGRACLEAVRKEALARSSRGSSTVVCEGGSRGCSERDLDEKQLGGPVGLAEQRLVTTSKMTNDSESSVISDDFERLPPDDELAESVIWTGRVELAGSDDLLKYESKDDEVSEVGEGGLRLDANDVIQNAAGSLPQQPIVEHVDAMESQQETQAIPQQPAIKANISAEPQQENNDHNVLEKINIFLSETRSLDPKAALPTFNKLFDVCLPQQMVDINSTSTRKARAILWGLQEALQQGLGIDRQASAELLGDLLRERQSVAVADPVEGQEEGHGLESVGEVDDARDESQDEDGSSSEFDGSVESLSASESYTSSDLDDADANEQKQEESGPITSVGHAIDESQQEEDSSSKVATTVDSQLSSEYYTESELGGAHANATTNEQQTPVDTPLELTWAHLSPIPRDAYATLEASSSFANASGIYPAVDDLNNLTYQYNLVVPPEHHSTPFDFAAQGTLAFSRHQDANERIRYVLNCRYWSDKGLAIDETKPRGLYDAVMQRKFVIARRWSPDPEKRWLTWEQAVKMDPGNVDMPGLLLGMGGHGYDQACGLAFANIKWGTKLDRTGNPPLAWVPRQQRGRTQMTMVLVRDDVPGGDEFPDGEEGRLARLALREYQDEWKVGEESRKLVGVPEWARPGYLSDAEAEAKSQHAAAAPCAPSPSADNGYKGGYMHERKIDLLACFRGTAMDNAKRIYAHQYKHAGSNARADANPRRDFRYGFGGTTLPWAIDGHLMQECPAAAQGCRNDIHGCFDYFRNCYGWD